MASKVKLAAAPVGTILEAEIFDGPCGFTPGHMTTPVSWPTSTSSF